MHGCIAVGRMRSPNRVYWKRKGKLGGRVLQVRARWAVQWQNVAGISAGMSIGRTRSGSANPRPEVLQDSFAPRLLDPPSAEMCPSVW